MYTNHNDVIALLRKSGRYDDDLAADLLGMHDVTSLSLDDWESAQKFIEWRVSQAATLYSPTPRGGSFILQKNGA